MPDVSDVREAIRPAAITRRPDAVVRIRRARDRPALPPNTSGLDRSAYISADPGSPLESDTDAPTCALFGPFSPKGEPRFADAWCHFVPREAAGYQGPPPVRPARRTTAPSSVPLSGGGPRSPQGGLDGLQRRLQRPCGPMRGRDLTNRDNVVIQTLGDSEDEGLSRCLPTLRQRPTCGPASSRRPSASRRGRSADGERVAWAPLTFRRDASSGIAGTTSIPGRTSEVIRAADSTSQKMHMRRLAPARACHRMCCNQARSGWAAYTSRVRDTTTTGGPVLPTLAAGSPQGTDSQRPGFCLPQVNGGRVIA